MGGSGSFKANLNCEAVGIANCKADFDDDLNDSRDDLTSSRPANNLT